ncbi:unnamed protein product [Rotaria sp. Silwood2]|nr:unnamed protein product [Rotaria sp. Silwood2]
MHRNGYSAQIVMESNVCLDKHNGMLHSSKACNISESEIVLNDMKIQFSRLNLNEDESSEKNTLLDQDILYYQRTFQNILRKQSSPVSINHGSSPSSLQSDIHFDNDIDFARYTAILNYLKDFSDCPPLTSSDGHQATPHMAADAFMDTDIFGCWNVYDSNGQCYCC